MDERPWHEDVDRDVRRRRCLQRLRRIGPELLDVLVAERAIAALDEPRNQQAGFFIADTLRTLGAFPLPREAVAFIAPTLFHQNVSKLMFTSREHVFRSLNGGANPAFPYAEVKEHCNVWTGTSDIDENGAYEPPVDVCDDWKAMGNLATPAGSPTARWRHPTAANPTRTRPLPVRARTRGVRTAPAATSRSTSRLPRTRTSSGRRPARPDLHHHERGCSRSSIAWKRIDRHRRSIRLGIRRTSTSTRRVNHAYITYSGYNHVTPDTPVTSSRSASTARRARRRSPVSTAPARTPSATCRSASIERDEKKGVLYAGTTSASPAAEREHRLDLGNARPAHDHVPYLKIDQDNRVMYVTTHGFGAWTLKLS